MSEERAAADDVAWSLADPLHSVRDRTVSNPVSGTVSVAKHLVYDAYGNGPSDTAPAVSSLFVNTARSYDAERGFKTT